MPTLAEYPETPVVIGPSFFLFGDEERGQWITRHLAPDWGRTSFKTGEVSDGIVVTHSRCCFSRAYFAQLQHPQAVSLLVFGVTGISDFGFAADALPYRVRPGDIWLLNATDHPVFRGTPAGQLSEMVVIKYHRSRLQRAVSARPEGPSLLERRAVRMARQQDTAHWVNPLLGNPLAGMADRLRAEADALHVLARWSHEGVGQYKQPLVDAACELLTIDPGTSPELGAIASQLGVSHATLNQHFRRHLGMTVFQWLREYRLSVACQYLNKSTESITGIAHQCGFSSASHFAQSFRARFGVSPGDYRRGHSVASPRSF